MSGNAYTDSYNSRNGSYVAGAARTRGSIASNPANRQMFFLPTCKTATWVGNHSCVGDMYAPDTDFTISGNSHRYGRIVAKTRMVDGNAGTHFDEALPPIGVSGDTGASRGVAIVK